ncbi:hypothetical protein GGR57DRAFT_74784 [Xylariaceae sp. FL1272]|nr:hypothetical protein GGR57DRAFT_74784 [Xylariaceae sp. FL1272]
MSVNNANTILTLDGLNLTEAYRWDKTQIYKFLDDKSARRRDLVSWIKALSDGNFYDRPRPSQHICRAATGSYATNDFSFEVPRNLWQTPTPPGPTLSLFILFDFLGYFLATLVPSAPVGANKANFFLPLTAVYGRWCEKLASVGDLPYMFNCTWYNKPDQYGLKHRAPAVSKNVWNKPPTTASNKDYVIDIVEDAATHFMLGAATAGYIIPGARSDKTHPWLKEIWEKRKQYLNTIIGSMALDDEYGLYQKLGLKRPGNATWGNCAETIPFVLMFHRAKARTDKDAAGRIFGCTLDRAFLNTVSTYTTKNIRGYQMGPCTNCQELLLDNGVSDQGFGINFW